MTITNPVDYLRSYIKKHLPKIAEHRVDTTGDGAEAYCRLENGVMFRLFIPRDAPANGKPLCNEVRKHRNEVSDSATVLEKWRRAKKIWSFEYDGRQFVGIGQKVRIHLHCLMGMYMLVHVEEGTPDKLYRVSRLNDESFRIEVEVLVKDRLAHQWGHLAVFEEREKRLLEQLRKQSMKV